MTSRRQLRGAERKRVAHELRRRYEAERLSIRALAQQAGYGYSKTRELLLYAGAKMRHRGGPRQRAAQPGRDALAAGLRHQFEQRPGVSINQLARDNGLGWHVAARLLKHAGVTLPKRVRQPPRPWTEAETLELRRVVAQGWSVGKIGRRLGRSPGSVQQKIKTLQLTGRRRTLVRTLDTAGSATVRSIRSGAEGMVKRG